MKNSNKSRKKKGFSQIPKKKGFSHPLGGFSLFFFGIYLNFSCPFENILNKTRALQRFGNPAKAFFTARQVTNHFPARQLQE